MTRRRYRTWAERLAEKCESHPQTTVHQMLVENLWTQNLCPVCSAEIAFCI